MYSFSGSMQITGLILAGGRSSRMDGQDKGLLKLIDKPMIDYVIQRLKPQVEQILISANRHIKQYEQFGYDVLLDEYDDFRGPLAGMAKGLSRADSKYLLTVPCDGPLMPLNMADRMLDYAQEHNRKAVFAFDGQYKQPTYNLIHTDLLPALLQSLQRKEYKLGKWLLDNDAEKVDFSDQKSAFLNVNTVDDLNLFSKNIHSKLL